MEEAGNREGEQLNMVGYGGEISEGGIYYAGYRKTLVPRTSN